VKVEINADGAYVEIEVADDGADLDRVAAKAQELWRDARPNHRGAGPAVGFLSQVAGQPPRDRSRPLAVPVRGEAHGRATN
jgi:hypothetical protein